MGTAVFAFSLGRFLSLADRVEGETGPYEEWPDRQTDKRNIYIDITLVCLSVCPCVCPATLLRGPFRPQFGRETNENDEAKGQKPPCHQGIRTLEPEPLARLERPTR